MTHPDVCTVCKGVGHNARAHEDSELAIVAALSADAAGDHKLARLWMAVTRKLIRAERLARRERENAEIQRGLELERERDEVFG